MNTEVTEIILESFDFTHNSDKTEYEIHFRLPGYKPVEAHYSYSHTATATSLPFNIDKDFTAQPIEDGSSPGLDFVLITLIIKDPEKLLNEKKANVKFTFHLAETNPEVKGTSTIKFVKAKPRNDLDIKEQNNTIPNVNE
jgi:hypothetical protein